MLKVMSVCGSWQFILLGAVQTAVQMLAFN